MAQSSGKPLTRNGLIRISVQHVHISTSNHACVCNKTYREVNSVNFGIEKLTMLFSIDLNTATFNKNLHNIQQTFISINLSWEHINKLCLYQ